MSKKDKDYLISAAVLLIVGWFFAGIICYSVALVLINKIDLETKIDLTNLTNDYLKISPLEFYKKGHSQNLAMSLTCCFTPVSPSPKCCQGRFLPANPHRTGAWCLPIRR